MSEDLGIYGILHTAVLQALIQARFISRAKLQELVEQLLAQGETDAPENALDELITAINLRLNPLDFAVRQRKEQITGEVFYSFVNQTADESIKQATQLNASEVQALNEIIDYIFDDGNTEHEKFSVTSSRAISIIRKNTNKTTEQADSFLKRLYYEGWLDHQKEYIPSTRLLSELGAMLVQRFGIKSSETPDGLLYNCAACKELVTVGTRCYNTSCSVRFHPPCTKRYFAAHESGKCPNEECQETWDYDTPEGLATIGPPGISIPWTSM